MSAGAGTTGRQRACANPACGRTFEMAPRTTAGRPSPYCTPACCRRAERARRKAREATTAPEPLAPRVCAWAPCGRVFQPCHPSHVLCSRACSRRRDHQADMDRRAARRAAVVARGKQAASRPLSATCPACRRGRVVRDADSPLLAYCARRCGWFDLPTTRTRQVIEADPPEDADG